MSEVSKLSDGVHSYDIKDSTARQSISDIRTTLSRIGSTLETIDSSYLDELRGSGINKCNFSDAIGVSDDSFVVDGSLPYPLESGTYIFSFQKDSGASSPGILRFLDSDGNEILSKGITIVSGYNEVEFTVNSICYSVTLYSNASGDFREFQIRDVKYSGIHDYFEFSLNNKRLTSEMIHELGGALRGGDFVDGKLMAGLKSCVVQNWSRVGSSFSQWHLVAEFHDVPSRYIRTLESGYDNVSDFKFLFLVIECEGRYFDESSRIGLLEWQVHLGDGDRFGLRFYEGSGYQPDLFKAVWREIGGEYTCQLWTKLNTDYGGRKFIVLDESSMYVYDKTGADYLYNNINVDVLNMIPSLAREQKSVSFDGWNESYSIKGSGFIYCGLVAGDTPLYCNLSKYSRLYTAVYLGGGYFPLMMSVGPSITSAENLFIYGSSDVKIYLALTDTYIRISKISINGVDYTGSSLPSDTRLIVHVE